MKKRKAAFIAADISVFALCLAAPCLIEILVRASERGIAPAAGAVIYIAVWALAWLYGAVTRASGLRIVSLTLWICCGISVALNIILDTARLGAASLTRLAAYVTAVYYTRPVSAVFGEPDGGPRGWCAAACAVMIVCFLAAYLIMPLLWRREMSAPHTTRRETENRIDDNPYTGD